PEEVTPGVANYYVSSYDGQAILVKTREGRPIKIEGNPGDVLGQGGASAQVQASVLDLYDTNRLKGPMQDGGDTAWSSLDSFVKAVLPRYRFDRADLIVGFGCDFLGSWLSNAEYTRQYASKRNEESIESKKMSRHVHFESGMSLTGSNADVRIPIKVSQQGLAL